MNIKTLPLTISWFSSAMPPAKGEATGILAPITWGELVEKLSRRREGQKDGLCFAPATFETKPDGRKVGRKKHGALSRTAVALDVETNKKTGEIPPPPDEALSRAARLSLAALVYTSHNHTPELPRYRVVIPLSDEIACEIPAPQIMAEEMGLGGVIDLGKLGPASLFYGPSCNPGQQSHHYFSDIDGMPVDADRITETGLTILRAEKLQQERIEAKAREEAAKKRAEKLAAGFDPDESLIEKIRVHLDLADILKSHRYDREGQNYRHPNSTSGQFGANIKTLGGIDRIFSHNATDPLHESNLPEWCGGVTALDAFDVVTILDFGGDRKKAFTTLAERYSLNKAKEKKEMARVIFRLIRRQASQEEIEQAAMTEGERLGLSRNDIFRVAEWVAKKSVENARAA